MSHKPRAEVRSKYPFASLAVGEYFELPRKGVLPSRNDRVVTYMRTRIYSSPLLHGRFKVTRTNDVVRVTRIA